MLSALTANLEPWLTPYPRAPSGSAASHERRVRRLAPKRPQLSVASEPDAEVCRDGGALRLRHRQTVWIAVAASALHEPKHRPSVGEM
jgi:hypothetical protein